MMMNGKGMSPLHKIAWILVIIGALNWGLVGINMDWNVVHLILGSWMWLERLIYILVGLSGLVLLYSKCFMKGGMMMGGETCMPDKDGKMMGGDMDKKM